jgi:hypothetical protein
MDAWQPPNLAAASAILFPTKVQVILAAATTGLE